MSSLLFCNYSYAQSSKPTVFKNGIQGNSNIFDSDGNNLGNLSSLISTANNAIPKSEIGIANGVAPLDSNGNYSGKSVGDVTDATLLRSDSTVGNIMQFFIPSAQSIGNLSNLGNSDLSTGPLATILANSTSGSVLNFGDTFFPYGNGSRVPHVKDANFFMNFLGRVNRYASGSTFGSPGSFIADDSIISGFWPAGEYSDTVHGSLNYEKYIPKTYDSSGNVISGTVADSIQDYAPVIHIDEEVADQYKPANWGGRNDVGALVVNLKEDAGSAASGVPIIASLETNGTGGYFANSVALKTYTTNYGINSSWGIDTRIEDHSGLEPHNDGVSGGGYNIIGNEIDLQTYGQDNPNIQYVPFGYRSGIHMGFGASSTDEASYGENVCAYHVGDRVLMPEYNPDGSAITDPWGNSINGVFKVTAVGGSCASNTGKTGSIAASSWVRGAGATKMWTKQSDNSYALTDSSLPVIVSGNTTFVWGEDEPTTVGSAVRYEGTSVENNFTKGDYGGAQLGAGIFMSGAFLDAGIDMSSMECGIAITDLIGGKTQSVPKTSCAALRMPKDIGIDFSSTYDFHGTTATTDAISTQNNRILKYDSGKSALTYTVKGVTPYAVKDSGEIDISSNKFMTDGRIAGGGSSFLGNTWVPSGDIKVSGQSVIADTSVPNRQAWSVFNDGTASAGYVWYWFSPYASPDIQALMTLTPVNGLVINTKVSLDNKNIVSDGSGNLQIKSLLPLASVISQTFATIQSGNYTEGEKVWCHDCRSPGQAAGAGTGRWIYKDSANTWRTEDGLEASN